MKCPLTGNPCSKTRTVHFTQIINGEKTELSMCEDCSGKFNPYGNIAKAFMHGFDGLPSFAELILGNIKMPVQEESPEIKINRCECGSSWNEIRKLGKIGCASCYSTFKKQLMPLIMKLQENIKHCGKEPLLIGNEEKLKQKMEQAINEEKYENAARIRDHLKK